MDYGKRTAVLWVVCKKLQARVDALEKPKKPKSRRAETPRERCLCGGKCPAEGLALQQPGLRILDAPEARAQVSDELQSFDGRAVALLELAGPAR